MDEAINCIFFNNNNKCDLQNDTEECFKGTCKDRIEKYTEEEIINKYKSINKKI